ncbi:MAG: bifunctional D-glycero-beta-D-manno-heptose-7-phosphate kinase/D-glycero-beta-D-manno-heptose 1-phosphate adenylyltransferase HldE [Gammaproteobacteria bacterium AqS3]|nr:bifunctional D-glycero-beta-D-manno-heptose-7-phosphate kinase/D-glycero-beta-D-manno-heptose 1-phosphate adenylyltransferase HldE [Gammaproteobacteria bacterium AqS3]
MPIIPNFSEVRVLVVGDLMLDRYIRGTVRRISPEAPVPVLHLPNKSKPDDRLGGAGNVAANIAAVGARCTLCAITGNDEPAEALNRLLQNANIERHLIATEACPTILKQRITDKHNEQQLLRIDVEEAFRPELSRQVGERVIALLERSDVVVLSDYGKGTLGCVETIIQAARKRGLPVLVDPKGEDFTRYTGATLITPNQSEFDAIVANHSNATELPQQGEDVRCALQLDALLITQGEDGMTLFQAEDRGGMRQFPSEAREIVFDVVGAGDTVIATLAASLGTGEQSLENCARLANYAASIAVSQHGTVPVSREKLIKRVHRRSSHAMPIIPLVDLLQVLHSPLNSGKKIVFTNGCFDLLHAGHSAYLEEAATLGDVLIVALNSDESVRRLKGPERPVNSLANRARVIGALKSVDYVIAYDDDTPEALLAEIRPHVLVKGGDYDDVKQVVGHQIVQKNGGEVKVLQIVDGLSTSNLIKDIKKQK